MKIALRRVGLTLASASLLVVGFDYVTYAATGSSLLLGHSNAATATTTLKNTGAGAALSLQVKSPATAPLVTNGSGLVKNLYAARAANADTLGGKSLAQVRTGIDAATVGGLSPAQLEQNAQVPAFVWSRTNASQGVVSGTNWTTVGIESAAIPTTSPYQISGTFTVACGFASMATTYTLILFAIDRSNNNNDPAIVLQATVPVSDCGQAEPVPATTVDLNSTTDLIAGVETTGCANGIQGRCIDVGEPVIASLSIAGNRVTKNL